MKRAQIFFTIMLLSGAVAAAEEAQQHSVRTYIYRSIDVPNARATGAFGVSNDGEVVGSYSDTGNRQHGFLLQGGSFTTIDFPGAVFTNARGIAPNGDIVGTYRLPGEPAIVIHGFLRTRDGQFRPADYPGHTSTIPQRVLPGGEILGCYHDADTMGTMYGFVMSADSIPISETDMGASMHNGATPDLGVIVGLYTDMELNKGRAYTIIDGVFTPFDYPGAKMTAAWDMNPGGAITGIYQDSSNRFHGFLWEDGEFASIDFPGAVATRAFGINARGDIVGSFVDASNKTHAFLARRRMERPMPAKTQFVE